MRIKTNLHPSLVYLLCFALLLPLASQANDSEELAKKLANPVADLISVPLQSNFDFGVGRADEGFRYTLNVQPVIPISLGKDWNLITRTILPVIYQESLAPRLEDHFPGLASQFGLGDTLASFFLSPRRTEPFIWGVGPALYFPTGTETLLSAEKWGAGPTAVLLKQLGPWTVVFLTNHVWSFAGNDNRKAISSTFLQPVINYTTKHATTFGLNTESTYDWIDKQWTVPIQLIVSQVIKIGPLPVSIGIAGRYWAEGSAGSPEWGIRLPIVFIFPK